MSKITEKIQSKLPVPLTEDEKIDHQSQVCRMLDEIDEANQVLGVAKLKNKMATERLDGSIQQKRTEIKNGIYRMIDCEAIYDLELGLVVYVRLDSVEEFERRAMTEQEIKEKRQLRIED